MRIIYIDDIFHPDAGYQVNLLSKYWVKFGHDVFVFTSEMKQIPRGYSKFFDIDNLVYKDKSFEERTGVKIYRFPLLKFISGRAVYSKKIFSMINIINPDVIFVNGNDSLIGIQLIRRYKKLKFGLVTDSHMLEMASSNRFNILFRFFYKQFVTPIIMKYDIPVIRAQDDNYVEKYLGIPIDRCPWISFGSDTTIFKPDNKERNKFRERNGINDQDFVVVYAGKISKTKGANILEKSVHFEYKSKRNIVFLIIGNTEGDNSIRLEESFSASKYRVIRFPTQKYYKLPEFYQAADIAVFPKQCSLSFYDVQACGLPVVFEENNINIDRSKYHNAITYRINDSDDFCKKIDFFADMNKDEFNKYSREAHELVKNNYDYEKKAKEYIPWLEKQAIRKRKIIC